MAAKPIDQQHAYLVAEVQKNRTEIKKLKVYDFSSIDSTITVVGADGAKQGVITPPAGMADINPGLTGKIKIVMPADPANLPQDGEQMSLNGSYLWMDRANNDIMQWQEIKDHVANGDIMVLKRLDNSGGNFKNFELVKWEIVPKAVSGIDIKVKYGNTPSEGAIVDVHFDNIVSAVFTVEPHNHSGLYSHNVPLVKSDETRWTCLANLNSEEHIMSLNKTQDGKTGVSTGGKGKILSYSITYKEQI